jgi:hypothetical protein
MENPNDVLMAQTMERFTRHNQEFQSTVMVGYNVSMSAVSEELQRKKEINRHRKQHEKDFKEAYEAINVNQWKDNQQVAKQRKELKTRIMAQTQQRRVNKHTAYLNNTRSHTLNSIDEFNKQLENNLISAEDPEVAKDLKSKLIKTVVGNESEGLPTLTYIDKSYLDDGLREAQKVMQEHTEVCIPESRLFTDCIDSALDVATFRMPWFALSRMTNVDVNSSVREMRRRRLFCRSTPRMKLWTVFSCGESDYVF